MVQIICGYMFPVSPIYSYAAVCTQFSRSPPLKSTPNSPLKQAFSPPLKQFLRILLLNPSMAALTWEPKIPSFGTASSSSIGTRKTQITPEISSLYKFKSELIDGLFVPPNNPKQLNKLRRKQLKDTAGADWFDMPAPVVTPELKQDLQLLKLRNVIDPKRHYKKGDTKLKTLPKYFQVGTVVESASDYYSARLTKKERKNRIADELLADSSLAQYRKRKVREIEEHQRPGGNEKWKIKGKFTLKRAKEKRHLSEQRHASSGNNSNKRFKRL